LKGGLELMSALDLSSEFIIDLKGQPLRADGAAVLKALDRMLTVGSYYSREHSQYLRAAEEACGVIVEAIARRPGLALEIAANGLLIEGQTVDGRHRHVRQLFQMLVPLNIARLEIGAALTPGDLRQALSALHDHRLGLGQAQGFREITIENLPPTVSATSRKVGRGAEADGSATLSDLLGGLSDEPADDGSREAEARREGLERQLGALATAPDHADINERLRALLAAKLDEVELSRLVDLAGAALAASCDPAQAELAFRRLRRELKLEESNTVPAPAVPPAPEDAGFSVEQLVRAVDELRAINEPLLPPESSARIDQMSIAFKLLTSAGDAQLPAAALSALEETWAAKDCGPEDVRLAAASLLDFAAAASEQQVDVLLPAVLRGVRCRRPDLVAPLWWNFVSAIRPLAPADPRWTALWPQLVNDLLLGLEPAPHPLTQPLYLNAGEFDTDQALKMVRRFGSLGAVRRENPAGDLLQLPVEKTRPIHAVLMGTAAADRHGGNLHNALSRRSADALTRLLLAAVGGYKPENRALYAALLREGDDARHSRELEDLAARILQRALAETPRECRDEDWLAPAIEWLRRQAPQSAPLMARIVGERRLLFFRAWPQACRLAATADPVTMATGREG